MWTIFCDVEGLNKVSEESQTLFEISFPNTSRAVQQESYIYFGLALLGWNEK